MGARLQAKGSAMTRARIALALEASAGADQVMLADLLDRFVAHLLLDAPARRRPEPAFKHSSEASPPARRSKRW